jgi:hypothetical protein
MKIFVSWSKEPARTIALQIRHLLSMVLGTASVWVSEEDIPKGKRWSDEVSKELDLTDTGIVVCTANSVHEPWLNFEAGALAKKAGSTLHCICFGIQISGLSGPLGLFQATAFERGDMLELIRSLNDSNATKSKPGDLDARFDLVWPAFEKAVSQALGKSSVQATDTTQSISVKDALHEARQRVGSPGPDVSGFNRAVSEQPPRTPEEALAQAARNAFGLSAGPTSAAAPIAPRLSDGLEQGALKILNFLAENNRSFSVASISAAVKQNPVRAQHFLDLLKKRYLVSSHMDQNRVRVYKIDAGGRAIAVQEGWV